MIRKGFVIALGIVVCLFIVNYIQMIKDKQLLLKNLGHMSNKLYISGSERDVLNQKIAKLNSKLTEAKSQIKQLQIIMALLEEEKARLYQEAKTLGIERALLEKRFHSFKELRKAMRELKKEMHLVRKQMQRKIDEVATMGGNQGYLIQDGKSTFQKKIKIRVIPVKTDN